MENYLELLKQFISFQSVSTDPAFKSHLVVCAEWLITELRKHGFATKRFDGYANPIVFGSYEIDPSLPTYLIYGHYDVQPAAQEDGWKGDPFTLVIDEEKVYGRGVVDNKWQHLIHLATIFDLIERNELAYNIKFLIEWNEESGGVDRDQFFQDNLEQMKCDWVIISDGEIIGHTIPTMTQTFRGGANLTLTVKTADTDLHSGIYGNILPSASHELTKLCAKLYDERWLIAIPGWYDDVAEISEAMVANNLKVPFSPEDLFTATGCSALANPDGYDPVTANWLLPTIQVSGLKSGYTDPGYKNIIPAIAIAKMNFRFAPGQDAFKMVELFECWVKATLPSYCSVEIETSEPYNAIALDTNTPWVELCRDALAQVYEKPVVMRYCGAAVPISGTFQEQLGVSVACVDLGNEDCNMHGINENFRIENIEKGLKVSELIFKKK